MEATIDELQSTIESFLEFARLPITSIDEIPAVEEAFQVPCIEDMLRAIYRHKENPFVLNEGIKMLVPGLDVPDVFQASRLAQVIGMIVEWGGEPALAIDSILDRLEGQLTFAQRFVEQLEYDYGIDDPEAASQADLTQAAQDDFEGFLAWRGLQMMVLPAMTMLARDIEARKRARQRDTLLQGLSMLECVDSTVWYLWELLSMIDGLEVLVLYPEAGKGFVVELEAVRNNFHFFTLLQCILLSKGYVAFQDRSSRMKTPPSAKHCAVARGELPLSELDKYLSDPAVWSYSPWFSLKPDGTYNNMWFIGGEHLPSEIPHFEGMPVMLLGNHVTWERTWDVNFFAPLHEALRSQVHVQRTLNTNEVVAWVKRISTQLAQDHQFRESGGCAICGLITHQS